MGALKVLDSILTSQVILEQGTILAIIIGFLIPCTVVIITDYKEATIYDTATYPMALSALVVASIQGRLIQSLIAGAIIFIFYLLLNIWPATRGGLGGGDLKFQTAIFMWVGVKEGFFIIILSSILAYIVGFIKDRKNGVFKQKMKTWLNGIIILMKYSKLTVLSEQIDNCRDENGEIKPGFIEFGVFLGISVWIWFILNII